jgi:flagellar motor switch protein FliG
MHGSRKTAILLLSLDQTMAAQVLGHLPSELVERATLAIAEIEDVSLDEQNAVLFEFQTQFHSQPRLRRGGPGPARELLAQTLGEDAAAPIQERVEQSLDAGPFAFLSQRSADDIRPLLMEESPQLIAVVAAQLPPALSASVLESLPADQQADVLQRVARLGPTGPEVLADIAAMLKNRLTQPQVRKGGVSRAAALLRESARATSRSMLAALDDRNADLADELRQTLFSFDDLLKLDNGTLRLVLQETDDRQWAMALKASPEPVRRRVLDCLSPRVAQAMKDEMDSLGPIRLSEMTAVRQQIADSIRRLEDAGMIELPVN